ncbi:hypothetical protein Syun_009679 [Stephania yunnanensis]|uniref:Uncharacterized protein n=1 Tax=Stephania yunnanensis TaxID=152371 RepID=A0AAP0KG17_9MAGN
MDDSSQFRTNRISESRIIIISDEGMQAMQWSGKDVLELDQASLYWDYDSKVHCANFLVVKHSTSLLCHSYQSTGAKLGPTVSVREECMKGKERGGGVAEEESHGGNEIDRDDDGNGSGDSDGGDDDVSDDDDDDDDDGRKEGLGVVYAEKRRG